MPKIKIGLSKISTIATKTKERSKQNLHILQPIKRVVQKYSKYYIHAAIIVIALVVALFNVLGQEETVTVKDSSILANLVLPEQEKYEVVKSTSDQPAKTNYLSIISIASASQTGGAMNTNKNAVGSTAITTLAKASKDLPVFNNDTLVKNGSVQTTKTKPKNKARKEPFKYFVTEDDTITSIAYKFSIDPATILVENDLYADDIIKPGMELNVLPVPGASKTVESGETLEEIASAYEADIDEIIKFNKLAKADSIKEGQILVIPDGVREVKERPIPEPEIQETLMAAYDEEYNENAYEAPQTVYEAPVVQPRGNVGNSFPWGQCTWYAAQRRGDVTWMGNAGEWLWNAQAQGRPTGRIPAVGAILVTSESWWGHVSIVEAVNGDQVTISEMNYAGFGITSTRTLSNSSGVIKGYIY